MNIHKAYSIGRRELRAQALEATKRRVRRNNIICAWLLFIIFGGLLIAAAYVGR